MKSSTTIHKPPFQPVTLNITFETPKELEIFHWMCSFTVSIPEELYRENEKDKEILSFMLESIHKTLQGHT